MDLGRRSLNSKRIKGAKLCGACYHDELKALRNGEFVAYEGYGVKQQRWNEPGHVVESRVLGRNVPVTDYDNELHKHHKETGHKVKSKPLGGYVSFNEYKNDLRKHYKETDHKLESGVLGRNVPFNEYGNELRKHYKETDHVMKSKALGGRNVPFNVYGKLWKRVKKRRILREMQAHESMNRSSCANSGCDCRVSPTWFTLSNMESELILRCELAGITRTKEQIRRKLERMFTVVSTAMKENQGMYFCLECKEKEFSKVGKRLQRVDEK